MSLAKQVWVHPPRRPRRPGPPALEIAMRRVSVGVSVVALVLMASGFLDFVITPGDSLRLPGSAAVPLTQLFQASFSALGVELMSLGILTLAALPAVRVLLALVAYARQRAWRDGAVALVVLLILLLSTRVR